MKHFHFAGRWRKMMMVKKGSTHHTNERQPTETITDNELFKSFTIKLKDAHETLWVYDFHISLKSILNVLLLITGTRIWNSKESNFLNQDDFSRFTEWCNNITKWGEQSMYENRKSWKVARKAIETGYMHQNPSY